MNRFGYQFFTRSAFSRDKHGSIGTGNPGNGIQNVRQSLTLSYNMTAIQRITLFLRYFGRRSRQFQCRLYPLQQSGIIPRLRYKIKCPGLHTLHSQLNTSPCRHQDNRHIGTEYFHLLKQRQTFLSGSGKGKIHVHQNEIRSFRTNNIHRFTGTGNCQSRITGTFQHKTERRTDSTVIIND